MTVIRRLGLAACLFALPDTGAVAQVSGEAIKSRNLAVSRSAAANNPRSEGDQAIVDGWPLYRTERGQAAFNDAMAVLKATEGPTPQPKTFAPCPQLHCNLRLPEVSADGWLAQGRLWVSPSEYVIFVHSPRLPEGRSYRRRTVMDMRWFVFHEFHNSSRNTDMYDTISSHKSSVFVPFYMSKEATDAKGRRFVTVVQVAPHDVFSIHASNRGSSGPGIEVAKNMNEALEPLQAMAGVLVATMSRNAVPRLQVVNHRGSEGLGLVEAYEQRLSSLRAKTALPTVALPFVVAQPNKVQTASARFDELLGRRDGSRAVAMIDRGIVPRRPVWQAASLAAPASGPVLIEQPRPVPRPVQAAGMPKLIGPIRPVERPVR